MKSCPSSPADRPHSAELPRISVRAECSPGKIALHLCGRDWELLRPADLESLWDAITDEEFTEDERLPYWVELWPSSLALAAWLESRRDLIAGRTCLDLGCGLGFTAIVSSWLGARTVGIDYELAAVRYARRNALHNNIPAPAFAVMDWRAPALAPRSCAFIWGGDIMYENRFVDPVLDCLDYALADNGLVWMAEPGRGAYEHFMHGLARRRWLSRPVCRREVDALHVQKVPVNVNLWELRRS